MGPGPSAPVCRCPEATSPMATQAERAHGSWPSHWLLSFTLKWSSQLQVSNCPRRSRRQDILWHSTLVFSDHGSSNDSNNGSMQDASHANHRSTNDPRNQVGPFDSSISHGPEPSSSWRNARRHLSRNFHAQPQLQLQQQKQTL